MAREIPFSFDIPVSFFEKADAEPGKQRRIGGIVTTDSVDRQGEVILQHGLDFSEFIDSGWYNDNHTKETTGILGYPEQVQMFRQGEKLPDGTVAKANGHWAEGYLLDTERANKIWELGKALAKTKRRLGFSVEGGIVKRTGKLRKTIAQAKVRNVAITNCPVNTDSRLDVMVKSMQQIEVGGDETFEKMLGMGPATPGVAPTGDAVGMGAGKVLAPQSLESKERKALKDDRDGTTEEEEDGPVKKSMAHGTAREWLRKTAPWLDDRSAMRVIRATVATRQRGHIQEATMGQVSKADLQASLAKLEEFAKGGAPDRKAELLAKALQHDLDDAERAELVDLVGGSAGSELGKSLTEGLRGSQTIQDALDVSAYLAEQHTELCKSLASVGEAVERSSTRQTEINLVLAKALADVGAIVTELQSGWQQYLGAPARAPKSVGVQPLNKAFAGQAAAGESLSKSQVLDALDLMHRDSLAKGHSGTSPGGEDLMAAIAKYEMTSMISPGLLGEVQQYRTVQH